MYKHMGDEIRRPQTNTRHLRSKPLPADVVFRLKPVQQRAVLTNPANQPAQARLHNPTLAVRSPKQRFKPFHFKRRKLAPQHPVSRYDPHFPRLFTLLKPRRRYFTRLAVIVIISVIMTSLFAYLFQGTSSALISLRAGSSAQNSNQITLSGGSAATGSASGTTGGAATSFTIAMPTGVKQGDIMVAAITAVGGTGETLTSTGWTSINRTNSGTALAQEVFWKYAGASEAGPYTFNLSASNKASGVILAYTNVASASPIDVSSGGITTSGTTTITAPSVTTTVANDMLLGFFGHVGDYTDTAVSFSSIEATAASTGNGASSRTRTSGSDALLGAAGATGSKTETTATAGANIGQLVAIKPSTNATTSLTIPKPTGTVQGDVIVAAITISGNITFTPPSGWTSIQSGVTAGNEITTQSWWLAAGASEPSSYTWSWTTFGAQLATGTMAAYSGVDTSTPIDASGKSVNNTASTTVNAPSVTTTHANDQLVLVLGANTSTSLNPNVTNVQADAAAYGPSTTANHTNLSDTTRPTAGATGAYGGNAGASVVSIGQTITLMPATANLTQASHRWFGEPNQQAGVNWIARTDSQDNGWDSIAYGNGTFVAVSLSGTNQVMTSTDGITWTNQTAASAIIWSSVTYGNGLFVAVSSSAVTNSVMTSPDGITWTIHAAASANTWKSVTYGNGTFVAVSNSGTGTRVMTSSNGTSWTTQTSAADNNWLSVVYGNGEFVALSGATGSDIMTSPDGAIWTLHTTPNTNQWNAITFGNGLFVAVGQSGTGNRVMTSPDGVTWTSQTSAADNTWKAVAFGAGLFVAVAQSGTGNRVMTSPNGITWTTQTSAVDNLWAGIIYANNTFVAVGTGSGGIGVMTSDNLVHASANTWTGRTAAATSTGGAITYGNGLFVTIGSTKVMTSPDGITWTSHSIPSFGTSWNDVTYGNGTFVAVGSQVNPPRNQNVMTSTDGITWTVLSNTNTAFWYSVAFANSQFVAVNNSAGTSSVMTSPDGTTWTTQATPNNGSWSSITYGNGRFVAVRSSATGTVSDVMTSTNGTAWATSTTPTTGLWNSITYGNGLFVAASSVSPSTNAIMTSSDGITWTSRTTPTITGNWGTVTYGNGLFVAADSSSTNSTNAVMASLDGVTWALRTTPNTSGWGDAVYGNGLFVVVQSVASLSSIMTSPAIDASVGDTLAAQDTALTDTTSDSVRLRINIGVNTGSSNYPLNASDSRDFSLQYANMTSGVCSAGQTYYDVGTGPWVAQTTPSTGSWGGVTYGNGLYVAVRNSGTGTTNDVMTSPDGIIWTPQPTPSTGSWQSVTYGNGLFVAVSSAVGTSSVMTSPDGIIWTSQPTPSTGQWASVTYGNGLFVAVSSAVSNNYVMTSINGSTWTSRNGAFGIGNWQSVTYGNGLFVAVSSIFSAASVMTSPDGINWNSPTIPSSGDWYGVTYGNNLFVAISGPSTGTSSNVMTSPDGIKWTTRTTPAIGSWRGVTYGNGLFVAVSLISGTNAVMTSPDGITWATRTTPSTGYWNDATFGNGYFVAVRDFTSGTTNDVMSMSPPVNWGGKLSNNYGTVVSSGGSDPTQGVSTILPQNYITDNLFTNPNDVAVGQYGLWDFDLDLTHATYENTYCFQIVNADGSVLNSYNTYPQITRCTAPTLDRRLRHGTAFCKETKRFMWSRAGT
jgi:hypothetical protein